MGFPDKVREKALVAAARIIGGAAAGGAGDLDNLRHSILGTGGGGTLIAA